MFLFLLVKDLCRDIYDIYAEYEDEQQEEEDRVPVSPSRLLLSPTKHLTLHINVGGTVSVLTFSLAPVCTESTMT